MNRRFGTPPLPGVTYRPRPGAYAVLWRDGRVLLTHQSAPEPEYQLPGGGIDPGESPITALHREVAEETGWTISPPRHIGTYRRFCYMPDYDRYAEKLCSVWIARPVLARGAPSEPGHSAHWMTPGDAMGALMDPGSRAMLARALRSWG
ncbi:NUDIX hydrolase [Paracoccus sp. (in: a-proteobacteria)]|uniref:NUDIX hydrolase n=1 Tax=Paracoccus sp. TaxID=267 RepID=UPI0026DFD37C|nr:NUDIX hydrolase [Paracoccus sp. (in: a-proteobacteria)]MDO5648756.1 NUDIX hydrolase [Paracoccus sp. (in: a-proteobacteria)]